MATPTVPIWFSHLGYCDPSLPCGNWIPLSCPCPTTVPTVPSLLSGVCGNNFLCGGSGPACTNKSCCGIDEYLPCWYMLYATGGMPPLRSSPNCGGTGYPRCCGYSVFPPCGSSTASVGKSGKSTTLATTATTCRGTDPPCCGFEFYPPCGFTRTGPTTNACGGGNLPPCANSLSSGKSGKGYGYTGVSGSDTLTMEQLSAEVDRAVEEAVKTMVNIGELNVFEGKVNMCKYGDDDAADVVDVVASEGLN